MRGEAVEQRRQRDLGEGTDAPVHVIEDMVGGRGIGCDHAPEPGAFGGERAGVGVFECHRLVGAQAEMAEREAVKIRLGLRSFHVVAAGERVEARQQPEAAEVLLAVCVIGVGGQRDRPALGGSRVHQFDHARQDRLGERAATAVVRELLLEFAAIGVGAEGAPRIKGVVGVAHAADEEIALERQPVGRVHVGERIDQRRFRVEDQTIEVEDEGAWHGGG